MTAQSARARKPSIRSLVLEFLEAEKPGFIDQAALGRIRQFAQSRLDRQKAISNRYLVEILSETTVEIDRTLGGLPPDLRGRVHLHNGQAARESLLDLLGELERARAGGDRQREQDCRRAVRQGADRLRFLLARPNLSPEKQTEKQEILRWFVVWLETPELFEDWLGLREQELERLGRRS